MIGAGRRKDPAGFSKLWPGNPRFGARQAARTPGPSRNLWICVACGPKRWALIVFGFPSFLGRTSARVLHATGLSPRALYARGAT